ncbi:MAG: bifunctional phosphopantothenoylcysteine decarboxylase/phosphopantothenate--cysteine ligase CoaBC [Bacillaceae bacterium]|nr:bifunctional phosphopantothenoylcysteine decarboxylase/phosphopantothenate--cysteine ligase CoaBC [Bacillaceae bacterium]
MINQNPYDHNLDGKTVLLGVTGGIAAYKAAALASKITQAGADLHVIMTESAARFVQPLTFQTLSRNHVILDTFEERDPRVVSHIDLADRADLVIIAPATANFLGKLAGGIADDMLTTTLLAVRAPVFIAPAMNVHMYDHPAVKENMKKLYDWGYHFIEPGEGQLACGYVGKGRLEEPEQILHTIDRFLSGENGTMGESKPVTKDLKGLKILVTAGPTREAVDPVRFFTNRSTGKMGYALAEAARDRGADVILITGKTHLVPPDGVQVIQTESAQNMYDAVLSVYDDIDAVAKAAAVADYRPAQVSEKKIKKGDGAFTVEMERTPDILKTLGKRKTSQFLIGFAAESNDVEHYAKMKIQKKNLDLIVANNILEEGAGFETDSNIVTLIDRNGRSQNLPRLSKRELADKIWDEALKLGLGASAE